MYKHILIATDGSHLAHKAVATGIALAQSLGARVTALTVTEPPTNLVPENIIGTTSENEHDAEQYPAVTKALDTVRDQAEAVGVPCTTLHVRYQYPAEPLSRSPTLAAAT